MKEVRSVSIVLVLGVLEAGLLELEVRALNSFVCRGDWLLVRLLVELRGRLVFVLRIDCTDRDLFKLSLRTLLLNVEPLLS